ncbi:hypothetical protein ACOZ4I_15070 [Haloarcula salina]|uniref:hypothetical protein n=1 Tax=Haloarcula salina TaxID=1429914 RepID=UPI003C6EA686
MVTAVDGVVPEHDRTALGLGALFAALVAISVWTSAVGTLARLATRWVDGASLALLVVSAITSLGGLALGAVAYAWYRDLDLRLALPRQGSWSTALAVTLAPAALAVCVAIAGNTLFDTGLSAMTQRWVSADASAGSLIRLAVLPAAFVSVGYGLLFCGVVYEGVRDLLPEHAVSVAASLVAVFWLLPIDVGPFPTTPGAVIEVVLSLVFGVAFGMAVGVLSRHRRSDAPLRSLEARHAAVLALAAVGVLGLATDLTPLAQTVGDLLWVAAFGIGLSGYERTRSVWVPIAALAVFQTVLVAVIHVEAQLGLALL